MKKVDMIDAWTQTSDRGESTDKEKEKIPPDNLKPKEKSSNQSL